MVLLIVLGVFVLFLVFGQIKGSSGARKHTYIVLSHGEDLLSELRDAETGQRGYLLTDDEVFLEPYLKVRDSVLSNLKELRQLTVNSKARKYLDALVPLVDAKLVEMAQVIEFRRNHDIAAALGTVRSGQGKRLMDSIRVQMRSFANVEEGALAQHDAEFQANMLYLFITIIVVSLLVLLFAFLFAYLIYLDTQQQITRKSADAARELAENIINTVREPLIVLDQDLRVASVNRSFYDVFKVKPEETVGQLIYDLGNKQWDIPKLRELLETILPKKTTFDNYEVEHDFATIGRRIMLLNARQILRVLGHGRIILLAIEDITDKKKLEREALMAKNAAESANRSKSVFLSNMSHELRTPLNAVIGFSEVLIDQKFGALNDKQKDYLNDILESGKFLLSLINDILDLAKVESGKTELVATRFSLKKLLEHSLIFVKEKALKHNIEILLEITKEVGYICADERKVRQIIFNLLSNAVKFTPDGGKVGINARINGSEVEVIIWDTGIGISKEDQNKLFRPFMQLESSLERKYEGTGLGLSLTKELVELHKGRISVESEGKDKGSSFKFSLSIGAA